MTKNDDKTGADKGRRGQILSSETYVEGILRGDRAILGKAITLVESTRPDHRSLAQTVVEKCLPHTGHSIRIGVTGPPGVGKSSFLETFGSYLTAQGRKLAVLAIDPSSQVSKGSILGDKTRMDKLASDPNAFIRPSPSGSALGGVAARTRESLLLCEAAGFDTVFIETVGVGQSETAVHGMVDFFLLLLQPGAGDELQGIKRGIVEMADLLAINKADGERLALAELAKREYARALHLFPPKPGGWQPKTITCSALTGDGMSEIWQLILDYQRITKENGWFFQHRKDQSLQWFNEYLEAGLRALFFENEAVKAQLEALKKAVSAGEISPSRAAERLLGIGGLGN